MSSRVGLRLALTTGQQPTQTTIKHLRNIVSRHSSVNNSQQQQRRLLSPSLIRLTHSHYHTQSHRSDLWQLRSRSYSSQNTPATSNEKSPSATLSSSPATTTEPTSKDSHSSKSVSTPKESRLTKVWNVVKKEALHYWHGTQLLGKEIKISARLQWKLLKGGKLTRRERRQLKRTTQDLLRLLPFSVFVIVPFMEFLLPVALKLFPNMLPSTFEDKYKAEEKKRKLLKVRLEMAKFLQETIKESGIKSPEKIKGSSEFKEFFRKVRSTGESPSTDDIVNVARLFEDDLTLDNLSRPQLVSMCRYMNINAFGTDNFLRYTIRNRLKKLEEDDKLIDSEGVPSLSLRELQHACASRGIRSLDVPEERMRADLEQWIDLHVHRQLSGTLLILSKAFSYNSGYGTRDASSGEDGHLMSLKDTLASLPDSLLNVTELEVANDKASYKQRLEVLKEQEELIEDEAEQEQKEEEARKAKKEAEEKHKAEEAERAAAEKERSKAEDLLPESEAKAADIVVDEADVRMTNEQVAELGEALSILSARSSITKEREDLKQLIEDNKESEEEPPSDSATASLTKRIRSMIQKIDKQLEEYDADVGNKMNMIQAYDGKISVADLRKALEVIRHRPADEAISVLVSKLDVDKDGFVPLDHVISLAEEEGLGVVAEDSSAGSLIGKGRELREEGRKPRKEDLVE